jgi:4-hydroxy-tetrahydrodipicolinate synthase
MATGFHGTYTALVTPFRDGEVDEPALRATIRDQIAAGVDGVVPCGSTGESATLSHVEHERVIAATVDEVGGRVKVIAGTGSNNTAEAARLTKFAREAGADAALMISPYYNKPTQTGLVRHYAAVYEAAELPIVVYNIPGRTGSNMLPETVAEMAANPGIVGIKEASGSLDQVSRLIHLVAPLGDRFTVLSGDDSLTLPMMAVGDFAAARRVHYELVPLFEALFLETNPIPLKAAMAMLGKMTGDVRLPLTPVTEPNRKRLEAALRAAGLVS